MRWVVPSASLTTPQWEAYRVCPSGRAPCGALLCQTVLAEIALLLPPDKRRRIKNSVNRP